MNAAVAVTAALPVWKGDSNVAKQNWATRKKGTDTADDLRASAKQGHAAGEHVGKDR
jgi:hypothetical protein